MKAKKGQKTFLLTKEEATKNRRWFLLDGNGKTLGRFASEIAKILRGKHSPMFTPHVDCGDGVIIINSEKVQVTGNKEAQKIYHHYTGHIGGGRKTPYRVMMARNPTKALSLAVKRMMPRTKLSQAQLKRLRIFAKDSHPMDAQKPIYVNG